MTHDARAGDFAFGADISSVLQTESNGPVYKDTDGATKPLMTILKNHGYNWIRTRVLVPPARMPQDAEYVIELIHQAHEQEMKVLVDFHYSQGWADPTNQPTPQPWADMTHEERVEALYAYTRDTIAAMAAADALPDMIQVGNEVGNGILWPDGRVNTLAGTGDWDKLTDYLYAGINGIDAGRGNHPRPKIMLHVDHGGNLTKNRRFFDKMMEYEIPFDAIGLSFYPWSHGTLVDLRENLAFLIKTYDKPVYIVETGYFNSPSQYFRDVPGPFAETPEGQKQWLQAVTDVVLQAPQNMGKGVMYWEPTWRGGRGYFDGDGNPQPVIDAFRAYSQPPHRTDGQED